jgi:hypothetical protein
MSESSCFLRLSNILLYGVNQCSVTVTNIQENQLIKRNGLFLIAVLEVSVHGQLALVLWSLGHIMARSVEWSNFSPHVQNMKEKRDSQVPLFPSKHTPSDPIPPLPTHLSFCQLPIAAPWKPSL